MLDLEHSDIPHMLDWNKTLVTLNSVFIGILVTTSSKTPDLSYSIMAVALIISLVCTLTSHWGIIKHGKDLTTETLPNFISILCIVSWGLFVFALITLAKGLVF
jgi:hypothetical protein